MDYKNHYWQNGTIGKFVYIFPKLVFLHANLTQTILQSERHNTSEKNNLFEMMKFHVR